MAPAPSLVDTWQRLQSSRGPSPTQSETPSKDVVYVDLLDYEAAASDPKASRLALSYDPEVSGKWLPRVLGALRSHLARDRPAGAERPSEAALEGLALEAVQRRCSEASARWRGGLPEGTDSMCVAYRSELAALANACADFAGRALGELSGGRPLVVAPNLSTAARDVMSLMLSSWRTDAAARLGGNFGS